MVRNFSASSRTDLAWLCDIDVERLGAFGRQHPAARRTANDEYDLATRVIELLADPDRRRAMGGIGLERIRSGLAWWHQAVKLLAAYDVAFSGRP